MQGERDEAQEELRKRAGALTAAKRKDTLLRRARDEADARRDEAVSAAAQAVINLAEAKRTIAFIGEARDAAQRKQQEAEATITRVRNEGQATIRGLRATISDLRTELEQTKRKARDAVGSQERTARHLLGVPAGASKNDIRAAWKRLAFTVHPDRCSGPEAKRLMQLANDALGWLRVA